jgi:hypothetical protein
VFWIDERRRSVYSCSSSIVREQFFNVLEIHRELETAFIFSTIFFPLLDFALANVLPPLDPPFDCCYAHPSLVFDNYAILPKNKIHVTGNLYVGAATDWVVSVRKK